MPQTIESSNGYFQISLTRGMTRLRRFAALTFSISLVVAACGEQTATAPESTPSSSRVSELLVGYVLPSTGTLTHLGQTIIKGVELARDEINASGGNVRLRPGDSGTSAEVASLTADDHLANGVSAIIGAAASGVSLSIIDKVTGAGVVMIAASNTSPSLTTYPDRGLYFRTSPTDVLRAQVLGELVTDGGVSNAGILYRADDYGENLAKSLEDRLENNGVNVGISLGYDPEGTSFDAEVQQFSEAKVDGVVLIAFNEGAQIISALIEAGIGPGSVPLFLGDGIAGGNLWEDVDPTNPAVLEGARVAAPSSAPNAEEWEGEETFPARFAAYAGDGVDTMFSAHAYDTLIVLALASLKAGSTKASDFAPEINDITRGGAKCGTYLSCAELIADGQDIDYDGASGPLDFKDAGEPSAGSYDIIEFNAEGGLDVLDQVLIKEQ